MSSAARRRRRRRKSIDAGSFRQANPIGQLSAARRRTRVKTRKKASSRLKGAVGWTEFQRQLERLKRFRRKRLTSGREPKKAVRSISLVERSNRPRNRGVGGPCIRRPDPKRAGEIRQRSGRGGPKWSPEERLKRFRLWC